MTKPLPYSEYRRAALDMIEDYSEPDVVGYVAYHQRQTILDCYLNRVSPQDCFALLASDYLFPVPKGVKEPV